VIKDISNNNSTMVQLTSCG